MRENERTRRAKFDTMTGGQWRDEKEEVGVEVEVEVEGGGHFSLAHPSQRLKS